MLMTLSQCFPILLLLPYVGTVDPDSASDSELSLTLAVGGGSYAEVARDCSGKILSVQDHPFSEVAGSISQQATPGMFHSSRAAASLMQD
jgi:hypothetical protein